MGEPQFLLPIFFSKLEAAARTALSGLLSNVPALNPPTFAATRRTTAPAGRLWPNSTSFTGQN